MNHISLVSLLTAVCFLGTGLSETSRVSESSKELATLYQSALRSLKSRDSASAKKTFQKLIAKGPKAYPNLFAYFDVYVQLIQLEVDEGFCGDARAHLRDLQQYELPEEILQLVAFIEAHLLLRETSAEKALMKLEELKERLPFAQWPQREKLFHHSVAYQQDSAMDALMVKADEAFQNKDLPRAWGYFKDLIGAVECSLYPKAVSRPEIKSHIFFYGGKTLSLLGQFKKAAIYFSKALDLIQNASELPQIHYELGYAQMRQKAFLSALESLKPTVDSVDVKSPFSFRSLTLYAACALKGNRLKEAKRALELIKERSGQLKGNAKIWHQSGQLMIDYIHACPTDDSIDLKRLCKASNSIFKKLEDERPSDRYKLKLVETSFLLSAITHSMSDQQLAWDLLKKTHFATPQFEAKAYVLFLNKGCPKMAGLAEDLLTDRKFFGTPAYQQAHLSKGLRLLSEANSIKKTSPARARRLLTQAERHITVSRSLTTDSSEKKQIEKRLQECLHLLYSLYES